MEFFLLCKKCKVVNMYATAFLLCGNTMTKSLCLHHSPCNATTLWRFSCKSNGTFFSLPNGKDAPSCSGVGGGGGGEKKILYVFNEKYSKCIFVYGNKT